MRQRLNSLHKICPYRGRCNNHYQCYEDTTNEVEWCSWAQRLAQRDIESDLADLAEAQEMGVRICRRGSTPRD